MEFFEIEKEMTSCDINGPSLSKPLTKRRRLKKKASHPAAFIKLSQGNYQMWSEKLRKFRTTSWVVKICTDFAPVYPDLYLR